MQFRQDTQADGSRYLFSSPASILTDEYCFCPQMLCSVATLIHDSYLPVYVQDELGLSSRSPTRGLDLLAQVPP
jgi:hypothetical protein